MKAKSISKEKNMNTIYLDGNLTYQERYIREAKFVVAEEVHPSASNDILDTLRVFVLAMFINRKINKVNSALVKDIANFENIVKSVSKVAMVKRHANIKEGLDKYGEMADVLRSTTFENFNWYMKRLVKSCAALIENAKILEMKCRLAAYPESNEVVLTYDELRELNEALKGWESAEEQSDIYNRAQ
jgi:hypothetical protein